MPKAILHHAYLLFTLRHDGKNLPRSLGLPYLLLFLSGLSMYVRLETTGSLEHEEDAIIGALMATFVMAIAGLSSAALMTAVTLLSIVGNVLAILVVDIPPLRFAVSAWQVVALFFAIKAVQTSRQPT